MTKCDAFQFALACLIMAALTGLIGFVIVYHYATLERPLQHFAVVVDAGSTQTRSSLFSIELDVPKLVEWIDQGEDTSSSVSGGGAEGGHVEQAEATELPLTNLLQVKHVGNCVNGGPLAEIQSESGALELMGQCFSKFAYEIKQLDFKMTLGETGRGSEQAGSEPDELSDHLALVNHRVNSVTHIYLGATAGMRAIRELNQTKADERMLWVGRAIQESNKLASNVPFINTGSIGILEGSDEAAFGWISANFLCESLRARHRDTVQPLHKTNQTAYNIEDSPKWSSFADENSPLNTIGTLELGGASSQMAHQVPDWVTAGEFQNSSLQQRTVDLFNRKYQLATRSDLCLGMSQAVLRTNLVLVKDFYSNSSQESRRNPVVELDNPCMQRASRTSIGKLEATQIFSGPCLLDAKKNSTSNEFRSFLSTRSIIRFVGTGNTYECDQLLAKLIEPELCRQYFSLCPRDKNHQSPPKTMLFVTISGYNKSLQVLNMQKAVDSEIGQEAGTQQAAIERKISENLGGYAIDHSEFVNATQKFCTLDVSELPIRYPKMNRAFYAINCLQLVYINKLLTDFYLFDPKTSWRQIKFLIFPPASESKNELGWTLGLLLNETSHQYGSSGGRQEPAEANGEVFFHHGSSVLFVVRTTLFLMFACLMLALSIMVAVVFIFRRRRTSGTAYISHTYGSSSSTPCPGEQV